MLFNHAYSWFLRHFWTFLREAPYKCCIVLYCAVQSALLGDENDIRQIKNLCHFFPKIFIWNKHRKKTKEATG